MSFTTDSNNTSTNASIDNDDIYIAPASCMKPGHHHDWPIEGELKIERCEHFCLFCVGPKAKKNWSSAWFLRRHVRETHIKQEYPHLYVSEGWEKRPTGNTRPVNKKQRAPGSNKKRAGTKKNLQQALAASKAAAPLGMNQQRSLPAFQPAKPAQPVIHNQPAAVPRIRSPRRNARAAWNATDSAEYDNDNALADDMSQLFPGDGNLMDFTGSQFDGCQLSGAQSDNTGSIEERLETGLNAFFAAEHNKEAIVTAGTHYNTQPLQMYAAVDTTNLDILPTTSMGVEEAHGFDQQSFDASTFEDLTSFDACSLVSCTTAGTTSFETQSSFADTATGAITSSQPGAIDPAAIQFIGDDFDLDINDMNLFHDLTSDLQGPATIDPAMLIKRKPAVMSNVLVDSFSYQIGPDASGVFDISSDPAGTAVASSIISQAHLPTATCSQGYDQVFDLTDDALALPSFVVSEDTSSGFVLEDFTNDFFDFDAMDSMPIVF